MELIDASIFKKIQKILGAPGSRQLKILVGLTHLIFLLSVIFYWDHPFLYIGIAWGWLIAGLGGCLIGHRYVSHRQFQIQNQFVLGALYWIYNLNLIGSAVNYANMHALHHSYSDIPGQDPTAWQNSGLLKTHFTFYNYDFKGRFSLRLYRTLMRDKFNRFFHNYYYLPILLTSLTALALFGWMGVALFICVPAVVAFHIAQLQVSVLHYHLPLSYRNFDDNYAYNIPWLKLLLWGEELHNNHHAAPTMPDRSTQRNWREFDPLYSLVINKLFKHSH